MSPIRQRVSQVPQVDVLHSAAAGQLVLTVHVDMENGGESRPIAPVGFKRAIAATVQAVVDELMPFPSAAAASATPAPATKRRKS